MIRPGDLTRQFLNGAKPFLDTSLPARILVSIW